MTHTQASVVTTGIVFIGIFTMTSLIILAIIAEDIRKFTKRN